MPDTLADAGGRLWGIAATKRFAHRAEVVAQAHVGSERDNQASVQHRKALKERRDYGKQ